MKELLPLNTAICKQAIFRKKLKRMHRFRRTLRYVRVCPLNHVTTPSSTLSPACHASLVMWISYLKWCSSYISAQSMTSDNALPCRRDNESVRNQRMKTNDWVKMSTTTITKQISSPAAKLPTVISQRWHDTFDLWSTQSSPITVAVGVYSELRTLLVYLATVRLVLGNLILRLLSCTWLPILSTFYTCLLATNPIQSNVMWRAQEVLSARILNDITLRTHW